MIPSGILDMGLATADVKQVMIRPNALDMNVKNLSEVRLGGVAPVKPLGVKWTFGYDRGYVYEGDTGVWRMGVLSDGSQTVATIEGPDVLEPRKFEFHSFSLMSRGEPIAGLRPLKYRYYDIMDMTPLGSFSILPDGVDMLMNCSMAINGLEATTGFFSFYKKNGKIAGRLKSMMVTVNTGRGSVTFTLDTIQRFKPGQFTSYGTFRIPPEKDPSGNSVGSSVLLRGFLDHTKNKTDMKVIQLDDGGVYAGDNRQAIKFGGSPDKKMLVKHGVQLMGAAGAGWDQLGFTGNLAGMENIHDEPENELSFLVKGAVDLEKGKLSVDSLSTPLGDMTMVYDFANARLTGSLTIDTVEFGAVKIYGGTLGFLTDRNGFLVFCHGAEVVVNAAPVPLNHYILSFVIGAHDNIPPEITNEITANLILKELPSHLASRKILGMYMHGAIVIWDIETPEVELLVANASAYSTCGVEARIWFDMSKGFSFGISGLAYADAGFQFTLRVLPCDPLRVDLSARVLIEAVVEHDVFKLSGCASILATGDLCTYHPELGLAVKASIDSNGDFEFYEVESCTGE